MKLLQQFCLGMQLRLLFIGELGFSFYKYSCMTVSLAEKNTTIIHSPGLKKMTLYFSHMSLSLFFTVDVCELSQERLRIMFTANGKHEI